MRIISGFYKNRRVNFTNLNIRPTTNFAKESLFNILLNEYRFEDSIALDLFAGSGNISYEFASRGIQSITAIDNNIKCVNFIKKYKEKLSIQVLTIMLSNAVKYLKKTDQQYNIIFADPPYHYKQEEYDSIIKLIFQNNILIKGGTLIIEHSKFINFEKTQYFYMKRKYGKVQFTFLKHA